MNLFELENLIQSLQTNTEIDFAVLPNRYRNQLFTDCLINDIKTNISRKSQEYLFHTIWLIIHKDNNTVAGHMFFSGSPSHAGEVELYTEILDEAQEAAYMKEGLSAMITWAAGIEKIKLIRTNVPVNEPKIRKAMTESGFEKMAQYQHYENWIWKNEKNH